MYVRVTFLQQTVGIHSRLSVRLTEDEFENYFQRQDVKDFVDIERTVILRSVEEFKPETIESLNISQWTKYYNEDSIEIKECAEMIIVERFREAINPGIKVEDKEVAFSLEMMSSSIAYIKALDLMNVDVAKAYCKHYQTIFEIDKYEKAVLDTAEFTLWDWKLGLYQTSLRKVHGDNSNELLSVLTDLITEYQTKKT